MDPYSIARRPELPLLEENSEECCPEFFHCDSPPWQYTPPCRDCQRLNFETLSGEYKRGPFSPHDCHTCWFLYDAFHGHLNPYAQGYRMTYQPGELHDFPHLVAQEDVDGPSEKVSLPHILIGTVKGKFAHSP